MTITSEITLTRDSKPAQFRFHTIGEGKAWHWPSPDDRQFTGKTWRFLADDRALELNPLCDHHARLAPEQPPRCDRLTVWPVCWGYPDSLLTDHPAEVEQMRQDHRAGKFGSCRWEDYLEHYGKPLLWQLVPRPEMERHWLNWRTGPGHLVWLHAGSGSGAIRREVLQGIRFRAEFHQGETCETIWLAGCIFCTLDVEEKKQSPAHIAQQEERLRKEDKLQDKTQRVISSKLELVAKEGAFEVARRARQKEDARLAKQRAEQTVTRADCCEALKVGDRQLRKVCERFELPMPQTQRQLDTLLAKHRRHKNALAEALRKRTQVRLQKQWGRSNTKAGEGL